MVVCLSVCLSARISQEPHIQAVSKFLWARLPMALARFPSSGVATCYNNNNNNSHDNVYGAVIMTKVIARVHPVHLMNVD